MHLYETISAGWHLFKINDGQLQKKKKILRKIIFLVACTTHISLAACTTGDQSVL